MEEGVYLKITGRIKEQFKLENGKYVVPGPIEAALVSSKYISQVRRAPSSELRRRRRAAPSPGSGPPAGAVVAGFPNARRRGGVAAPALALEGRRQAWIYPPRDRERCRPTPCLPGRSPRDRRCCTATTGPSTWPSSTPTGSS